MHWLGLDDGGANVWQVGPTRWHIPEPDTGVHLDMLRPEELAEMMRRADLLALEERRRRRVWREAQG